MSPARADADDICDRSNCAPIREILDRVGDKWSLYVIKILEVQPQRFSQIKRRVNGISQRMLTLTLRNLERDGLLTRTVGTAPPLRVDYALTALGRSLLQPIEELLSWALSNRKKIEKSRATYDRSRPEVEAKPLPRPVPGRGAPAGRSELRR